MSTEILRRCCDTCFAMLKAKCDTWSVIGWRSAWYASSSAGSAQPSSTAAGIHAIAGVRDPQMRRLAGDEDAAVLELVGDQPAADPILLGDDLVFEAGWCADDVADRPVAVDRVVVRLVIVEKVVNKPGFLPVDRHHGAAATRVEGKIHPSRLPPQQALELEGTKVSRLHTLVDRDSG